MPQVAATTPESRGRNDAQDCMKGCEPVSLVTHTPSPSIFHGGSITGLSTTRTGTQTKRLGL